MIVLLAFLFDAAGACSTCHAAQARSHQTTGMAKALQKASDAAILRDNPELTFREGEYRTTIRRDGTASRLTVTDGKSTIEAPLLWAFGLGAAGQTYVFEHNGVLHESRLSYYKSTGGLDLTMGAHGTTPATLEQAAGRPMDGADVRECFGCHSSGGVRDGKMTWASLQPGVSCANCHVVPEGHASGGRTAPKPASLKRLGAEEMSDLCGSCHRTWAQVAAMGLQGVANVRFQPYLIANSKCYDAEDRRIGCTACHNPHAELETRAEAYDAACGGCHAGTAAAKATPCPVEKRACVTCHMPKYEIPGSHFQFTDHQIRVVRPGAPYPN